MGKKYEIRQRLVISGISEKIFWLLKRSPYTKSLYLSRASTTGGRPPKRKTCKISESQSQIKYVKMSKS